MDLKSTGVAALTALILAAVVTGVFLRRRGSAHRRRAAVANSSVLTALPEFRSALRAHQLRLAAMLLGAGLVMLGGVIAAGRPLDTTVDSPTTKARDIMLCLDVSPSMNAHDAALVGSFETIVKSFEGERIGMVIFNAAPVTAFPLTDDYPYVQEQLAFAKAKLTSGFDEDFYAGTESQSMGTSLIGDGLAGCALAFDRSGETRPRSIILATDNHLAGVPLYVTEEAGELARSKGIRLYVVDPDEEVNSPDALNLRRIAEDSGGAYFGASDVNATGEIVKGINQREAAAIKSAARTVQSDDATVPLWLASLGLLVFLVASRRWVA